MMLSKKRTEFLKKIANNATSINELVFNKKYKAQAFFSGRDEDFVTLEFKDDKVLIEITIELTNHQYLIKGDEKIAYKVFIIDNNKPELFTEEHWTLTDSSEGNNKLREILCQLISRP